MLTDEDKEWIKATISQTLRTTLSETVGAMIEASETRLLTAFHRWASPIEMRQRTHAATLKALDSEMEYLADRVTKLDGGFGVRPSTYLNSTVLSPE